MPTNFLLAPGTNGFIATPFNLVSTELNALASTETIVSSVGGASGVFDQDNTASAMFGSIWFICGGALNPTAGGLLRGWFLRSTDGGTTFERAVADTAQPRAPDFVIPLFDAAYAVSEVAWAQEIRVELPAESFKVAIQNVAGAALPATGNLILLGPTAVAY